jgi:hypothetical protein
MNFVGLAGWTSRHKAASSSLRRWPRKIRLAAAQAREVEYRRLLVARHQEDSSPRAFGGR